MLKYSKILDESQIKKLIMRNENVVADVCLELEDIIIYYKHI